MVGDAAAVDAVGEVGEKIGVASVGVDDVGVKFFEVAYHGKNGVGFVFLVDDGVIELYCFNWVIVGVDHAFFMPGDVKMAGGKLWSGVVECPWCVIKDEPCSIPVDVGVAEDVVVMEVSGGESEVDVEELVAMEVAPGVNDGSKFSKSL